MAHLFGYGKATDHPVTETFLPVLLSFAAPIRLPYPPSPQIQNRIYKNTLGRSKIPLSLDMNVTGNGIMEA